MVAGTVNGPVPLLLSVLPSGSLAVWAAVTFTFFCPFIMSLSLSLPHFPFLSIWVPQKKIPFLLSSLSPREGDWAV